MFSALLSNAIDAVSAGGQIHIEGGITAEGQAEVRIEDDGPGIPDYMWPRLFEPFFTTKPAGQGTGLGLAIARSIAEGHGGTLLLQNRPERGLQAIVQLPYLEEEGRIPAVA
jgi:signal transduction histidine kinase